MKRRSFLATVGASTVLSGCFGSGSIEGEFDVGMSTSRFRPGSIAVAPGTTVVWKNTNETAHTVTAVEGGIPAGAEYFASGDYDSQQAARDAWNTERGGAIESGETYEQTLTVEGTYEYICIPHVGQGMTGTIEVTPDATRTPKSNGTDAGANGTTEPESTDTA